MTLRTHRPRRLAGSEATIPHCESTTAPVSSWATIAAIIAWLLAIVVAAAFDRPIAIYMHNHSVRLWLHAHRAVEEILKSPGMYYFTVVVAIVASVKHPLRWRAGVFILLATSVSGSNRLIKWIAGRTRPFKLDIFDSAGHPEAMPFTLSPFHGGLTGLFRTPNLCFPSGHATLAFATAAAIAILWPRAKWRWAAYAVAAIVAAERVAENAHWFSDAVAGAALGIGGVYVIRWIVTKPMGDAQPVAPQLSSAE